MPAVLYDLLTLDLGNKICDMSNALAISVDKNDIFCHYLLKIRIKQDRLWRLVRREHLAGTALDHDVTTLADGTRLLGEGQRRARIGGIESLLVQVIVLVRHDEKSV